MQRELSSHLFGPEANAMRAARRMLLGLILPFVWFTIGCGSKPCGPRVAANLDPNVHSDGGMQEEVRLKQAIDALSSQPFGAADLGVPKPENTEVTDYIVGQGEKAVPLLIEAIQSDDCVKV